MSLVNTQDQEQVQGQDNVNEHISIGEIRKLFCQDDMSPGSITWLPDGTKLFQTLIDYLTIFFKNKNYKHVKTPIIYSQKQWETDNYWEKTKEDMFLVDNYNNEDGVSYGLNMTKSPGHITIYDKCVKYDTDLPLKLIEYNMVHTYKPISKLNGLFNLRQFTQDDAHVFCTSEQVEVEINNIIEMIKSIYSHFNFEYSVKIVTKSDEYTKDNIMWESIEIILEKCIGNLDDNYTIDKSNDDIDGPKIDIYIKDKNDVEWHCGTIQLDLNVCDTKNLKYMVKDKDSDEELLCIPMVIHHTILGSIERTIGLLLESNDGVLPFWLDTKQIYIVPVETKCDENTYKYISYLSKLFGENYNTKVDLSMNAFPKKIKTAELEKYHYIFIIGDKEVENETISYRTKRNNVNGQTVKNVYQMIQEEYKFMNE